MSLPTPTAPFFWKDGRAITEDELKEARAMEAKALARGIDFSPVAHPLQGAARVADWSVPPRRA
ncbi:hypothetical protein [Phyllobacterium lublinensis]|uniref:hypothetical protein n=1 Tax=Phyllobacterium lublinensis TaxID=2875708 RepID=UPI001CCEFBCF|nr:hypothetical protein [Phyllobacterium sp. 2063]MBZ9654034.1 hypothetical protein [Phyllobacterium sp. 2063]